MRSSILEYTTMGNYCKVTTVIAVLFWIHPSLLIQTTECCSNDGNNNNNRSSIISIDDGPPTDESGALTGYYAIATKFLHAISLNRGIDPQQVKSIIDYFQNTSRITLTELVPVFRPLISDQIVFITLLVIGLMYVVVFPITGIIFCACRYFGKCGGRKFQHVRPSSNCACGLMASILLVCAAIFIFGTVMYGLNNRRLYKEIEKSPEKFTDQMQRASDYVRGLSDTLGCSIRNAYSDDYGRLSVMIEGNLSDRLVPAVIEASGANALIELQSVKEEIDARLREMEIEQPRLCNRSAALNSAIGDFARKLQESGIGANDSSGSIINIGEINRELGVFCNLSSVPRFPQTTPNFTEETHSYVNRIYEEAGQLQTKVDEVFGEMAHTNETVESTVSQIRQITGNISEIVDELRERVNASVVRGMKDFSNTYSWFEYVGLVLILPTGLITLCLLFGLLCGLFSYEGGKAPYDRSCSSDFGGCSLMAAAVLIFLFGWLIMLVTAAVFAVGYVGETQVCGPILNADLSAPSIVDVIAPNITIEVTNSDSIVVDVKRVLEGCKANQPVYQVMNLDSVVDLDAIIGEVKGKLDEFINNFDVNATFNVSSITYPINTSSIDSFWEELDGSGSLKDSMVQLANLSKPDATGNQLRDVVEFLTLSGNDSTAPLLAEAQNLVNATNALEATIDHFMQSARHVSQSIDRVGRIVEQINETATNANYYEVVFEVLTNETDALKNQVLLVLNHFLTSVNGTVRGGLGCGPLYMVYENVGNIFCQGILHPLHGFWLSLGMCLALYPVAVVCAVKLSKYFRRMDESLYTNGRLTEQARWSTSNVEMPVTKTW